MRENLKDIRQLYFLEGDISETIERAYEMGRIEGVLEYLEKEIKKNEVKK